jgi:hypothetical protein
VLLRRIDNLLAKSHDELIYDWVDLITQLPAEQQGRLAQAIAEADRYAGAVSQKNLRLQSGPKSLARRAIPSEARIGGAGDCATGRYRMEVASATGCPPGLGQRPEH